MSNRGTRRGRGRPSRLNTALQRPLFSSNAVPLVRKTFTSQSEGYRMPLYSAQESARLLAGLSAVPQADTTAYRAPVDELSHNDINVTWEDTTGFPDMDSSDSENEADTDNEGGLDWDFVTENFATSMEDIEQAMEEGSSSTNRVAYQCKQQRKKERWMQVWWEALPHVARERSGYIPPNGKCSLCGKKAVVRCPECSRHQDYVSESSRYIHAHCLLLTGFWNRASFAVTARGCTRFLATL